MHDYNLSWAKDRAHILGHKKWSRVSVRPGLDDQNPREKKKKSWTPKLGHHTLDLLTVMSLAKQRSLRA